MKIVITAKSSGIHAKFDPVFGRCRYFALFDDKGGFLGSYENDAALQAGGAGTAAARFVGSLAADAIVTGRLGPNAANAVKELGIAAYYGHFESISDAFSDFLSGKLAKADLD